MRLSSPAFPTKSNSLVHGKIRNARIFTTMCNIHKLTGSDWLFTVKSLNSSHSNVWLSCDDISSIENASSLAFALNTYGFFVEAAWGSAACPLTPTCVHSAVTEKIGSGDWLVITNAAKNGL